MKGESVEIDSMDIYQKILYHLQCTSCIRAQVAPDFLGDILVQKNATYTRINMVLVIMSCICPQCALKCL